MNGWTNEDTYLLAGALDNVPALYEYRRELATRWKRGLLTDDEAANALRDHVKSLPRKEVQIHADVDLDAANWAELVEAG